MICYKCKTKNIPIIKPNAQYKSDTFECPNCNHAFSATSVKTEEINRFYQGLKKLDQNTQLVHYTQSLLDLTYGMEYIKLRQDVNSSNIECWVEINGARCVYSRNITQLINFLRAVTEQDFPKEM